MKIELIFKLVDDKKLTPAEMEEKKEIERKKKVGLFNERGEWVEN